MIEWDEFDMGNNEQNMRKDLQMNGSSYKNSKNLNSGFDEMDRVNNMPSYRISRSSIISRSKNKQNGEKVIKKCIDKIENFRHHKFDNFRLP